MKKLASVSLLSIATLLLATFAVGSFSHASVSAPEKGITIQADGSPLPPPLPHGGPGAIA